MIHLFNGYYMAADKSSYTVGKAEESRSKRFFKPGARYYPTLASGSIVTGRICYDAFVLDNKKTAIYYQATT